MAKISERSLATGLWIGVVLMATACAQPLPPPVAFAASPAFAEIEGRALGVINGENEALVVEKRHAGFTAVRYELVRSPVAQEAPTWARACAGPSLGGEELSAFRWVEMESGRLVLVVASEANPDMVVQRLVLFDPADACLTRFQEALKLPVPGEVIAPGSVPAGVTVRPGAPGVRLVDQPKLLRLEGAHGDVEVLLGVRERWVVGTAQAVELELHPRRFLVPRSIRVSWREALPEPVSEEVHETLEQKTEEPKTEEPKTEEPKTEEPKTEEPKTEEPKTEEPKTEEPKTEEPKTEEPIDPGPAPLFQLPELTDGEVATNFVIRPGQTGTWVIEAEAPLVMLEVWHGCLGQPVAPLELWLGNRPYATGLPPVPESFVRGSGRGHSLEGGARRDLFALQTAVADLELDVAKSDTERCVRQISGFGFDEQRDGAGDSEPASE